MCYCILFFPFSKLYFKIQQIYLEPLQVAFKHNKQELVLSILINSTSLINILLFSLHLHLLMLPGIN